MYTYTLYPVALVTLFHDKDIVPSACPVIFTPFTCSGLVAAVTTGEYSPKYFFPFFEIYALTLNLYFVADFKFFTLRLVFEVEPYVSYLFFDD